MRLVPPLEGLDEEVAVAGSSPSSSVTLLVRSPWGVALTCGRSPTPKE
ncbi:hypothetical protein NKG05_27335 [Oerskovia sp. M15]